MCIKNWLLWPHHVSSEKKLNPKLKAANEISRATCYEMKRTRLIRQETGALRPKLKQIIGMYDASLVKKNFLLNANFVITRYSLFIRAFITEKHTNVFLPQNL